jgi:hypothetical protein
MGISRFLPPGSRAHASTRSLHQTRGGSSTVPLTPARQGHGRWVGLWWRARRPHRTLPILAPFPDRPWRSSLAQDGTFGIRRRRWSLSGGALAVPAPWPAAGPTLAFLQLLLSPANAAFSGHLLLGIVDPADELVSGQRRDVVPRIECGRVGDQRLAQVCGKLVHHPTGHSLAAHRATVAVQGPGLFHQLSGTDPRLGRGVELPGGRPCSRELPVL